MVSEAWQARTHISRDSLPPDHAARVLGRREPYKRGVEAVVERVCHWYLQPIDDPVPLPLEKLAMGIHPERRPFTAQVRDALSRGPCESTV